jgi:hypothetical protein
MTSIYLDKEIELEKVAGAEIKLTDEVDNWPVQVASMLHKMVPYLANYAVQIELDRVNEERGYAFGSAKVSNRYEKQHKDNKSVTIPIIVKDRMLKPFDIFIIDNKTKPLAEEVLNSHLFNLSNVEMTDRKPVDKDITMQWQAPTDRFSAYGNIRGRGRIGSMGVDSMKIASVLDIVTPPREYVEKLANSLNTSQVLKTALFQNEAFANSVEKILEKSPEPTEQELLQPSCVQLEKVGKYNFTLTSAHRDAFDPEVINIGIKEAADLVGDLAYRMQVDEALTYMNDTAEQPELSSHTEITKVGFYTCINKNSNMLTDGAVLKVSKFSGGSEWLFLNNREYALQDELVGAKLGYAVNLEYDNYDSNYGVFTSGDWTSEPLTIEYKIGGTYHCKTATQNLQLTPNTDIIYPAKIDTAQYLIPNSDFLPLPKAETSLVGDEGTAVKLAAIKISNNALTVTRNDDLYTIAGAPVKELKLNELNKTAAQFILGSCGIAMPELADGECVLYKNAFTLVPKSYVVDTINKEAAQLRSNWTDFSVDLTKMAALLQDGDTIDTVLSLGMITPDTVIEFINSIPTLEETADKLADLLLHIRVGLSTVPEVAVEACMRNLTAIIKKLKELRDQGVTNA